MGTCFDYKSSKDLYMLGRW